jgi:hypothetical protein
VVVRIGQRKSEVLWTQIGPDIPVPAPRPSKVLWVSVDRSVRFSKVSIDGGFWLAVPLQYCLTDREFLAAAIRYYRANSVARADIGTLGGHERLVAALSSSAESPEPNGPLPSTP